MVFSIIVDIVSSIKRRIDNRCDKFHKKHILGAGDGQFMGMIDSMNRYFYVLREFVTDSRGRVVIAQLPNISLSLLIVASVLRSISQAAWHLPLDISILVLLTYWSWRELKGGLSPFRQLLGLVGLLFAARHLLMLMASY